MKRSQLNPKPIKLTPIEACAFIGKAIKEYIENNPKRWKLGDILGPGCTPDIEPDRQIKNHNKEK